MVNKNLTRNGIKKTPRNNIEIGRSSGEMNTTIKIKLIKNKIDNIIILKNIVIIKIFILFFLRYTNPPMNDNKPDPPKMSEKRVIKVKNSIKNICK